MKIIDRKFLKSKTRTCHASAIAFHKGSSVFAWFGGAKEGLPDSTIYIQHDDGILTLGEKVKIAFWNPVLFDIDNELYLSFKRGEFCDRWQSYILKLTDMLEGSHNLDQCKCQIIPAGLNFAVKTKPYIDKLGYIYCGSSVETMDDWSAYVETWRCGTDGKFFFVDRSGPLTVPKKVYENFSPYYGKVKRQTQGVIQPSIWVDKDFKMHAFFRSSRGLGRIYYSFRQKSCSDDWEWRTPEATKFKNPNSSVDTVYHDGRLFLVHNPSDENRYPLHLSELDDKFNIVDSIVIGEQIPQEKRKFTTGLSYPYMILGPDNNLHLTYTYGRIAVEHVTIGI